jgi:hypothetical protein
MKDIGRKKSVSPPGEVEQPARDGHRRARIAEGIDEREGRNQVGAQLDDRVYNRGEGALELPVLDFDGNVVRQLPQGRNLPTQVLDTILVVLDEEERELNAPQFLEALVGEEGVQHERWARLSRLVTPGPGEAIDQQQPRLVVAVGNGSLGLMAQDRKPPVEVGTEDAVLRGGVRIERPENGVGHQVASISPPAGRSQLAETTLWLVRYKRDSFFTVCPGQFV